MSSTTRHAELRSPCESMCATVKCCFVYPNGRRILRTDLNAAGTVLPQADCRRGSGCKNVLPVVVCGSRRMAPVWAAGENSAVVDLPQACRQGQIRGWPVFQRPLNTQGWSSGVCNHPPELTFSERGISRPFGSVGKKLLVETIREGLEVNTTGAYCHRILCRV